MKIQTKITAIMAVLFSVVACNGNDEPVKDNWNNEIRLSSGVTVQRTRANNTDVPDKQIAENEEIGIYVKSTGGETVLYSNIIRIADGEGALNLSQDNPQAMYYPADGGSVKISAYHPYIASDDAYDFIVKEDQSNLPAYASSDLLYSTEKAFDRSKEAQSLTFNHLLSKVKCILTKGDGTTDADLVGAIIEIVTPERAVRFNPQTGTTESPSTSAKDKNIKIGIDGIILPPQTFAIGSQMLKITLPAAGNTVYYYKPTTTEQVLEKEKVYTYTIALNATAVTITSAITDWSPISRSGIATMD